MSFTGLDVFDTTLQKSNLWLKEITEELGTNDKHRAYLALCSTLHALRDRLTVDEAVQLGAQLPMLIAGFYYQGWDPSDKPRKVRQREDFLWQIQEAFRRDPLMGARDVNAELVVRAVFKVMARRVSQGEIEDVAGILPREIAELWPEESRR